VRSGWIKATLISLCALSFAACAPAPPRPPLPVIGGVPAEFPQAFYRDAAARGEPVYRIDSSKSRIVVYVYRGGPLARFGHDHVVVSQDVNGYALLAKDLSQARTDLYFPVDPLAVDETEYRQEAGFTTEPSAQDIAGTRQHMLRDVLEAERYPYVLMHGTIVGGVPPRVTLAAEITLHGVTRTLRIPTTVERGDSELVVSGQLDIDQTSFGITPYSILGGALEVNDHLRVTFQLRARPPGGQD
jgi:hypothetical protein